MSDPYLKLAVRILQALQKSGYAIQTKDLLEFTNLLVAALRKSPTLYNKLMNTNLSSIGLVNKGLGINNDDAERLRKYINIDRVAPIINSTIANTTFDQWLFGRAGMVVNQWQRYLLTRQSGSVAEHYASLAGVTLGDAIAAAIRRMTPFSRAEAFASFIVEVR